MSAPTVPSLYRGVLRQFVQNVRPISTLVVGAAAALWS